MLPIADQNPTRTFPFVNYLLIAVNVLAFAWEFFLLANGGESWVVPGYGLVPTRVVNDPLGEAFTIFTSMFMHGDLGHLGGNLLFLYIFGDNLEDAMGHARYVLFYFVCGIGAALAQVALGPNSPIPMVGASGAIAGVLGGYLVLYPRAPITVVNPLPLLWLFFGILFSVPAWVVIGEWFAVNLLNLWRMLGVSDGTSQGGVAFMAHLGGFVIGLVGVRAAVSGRPSRDPRRWDGFRRVPRQSGGPWTRSRRSWY